MPRHWQIAIGWNKKDDGLWINVARAGRETARQDRAPLALEGRHCPALAGQALAQVALAGDEVGAAAG